MPLNAISTNCIALPAKEKAPLCKGAVVRKFEQKNLESLVCRVTWRMIVYILMRLRKKESGVCLVLCKGAAYD